MQKTLTSGIFASKPSITTEGVTSSTGHESAMGLSGAGEYPAPATLSGAVPGQLALDKCADDYSTVQGGCCPQYVVFKYHFTSFRYRTYMLNIYVLLSTGIRDTIFIMQLLGQLLLATVI
jgi:hypothetical protein